ncbi:hypothetical protein F4778DRAFT_745650 [Xylariomycetidae sp. FL2044]|nr:hypothetical protein F4778DRAFT_745650 [Xylariomycetidae sp. FL2044]
MKSQETLVSAIENSGVRAFDPKATPEDRNEGQREFGALVSRTSTVPLMSALSNLVKPGRVPSWLRLHLLDILTLLPQRPGGVRATLEFVFSVHPSSAVKASEAAEPQKQGANITMEALKMASTLLSVPPASLSPEEWYPGIAPQLLELLDGNGGPDLVKVASYVIGFGVLGKRQYGAPGTAGWKAFAEPMLASIDPSLSSKSPATEPLVFSAGIDEVIDLRREAILVQPSELCIALNRLTSLLNSHPNPGLTKRLLGPMLLPLWTLSSWPLADGEIAKKYCSPAKALLNLYLRLSGSVEKYQLLIANLLFDGNREASKIQWAYEKTGETEFQVKRLLDNTQTLDLGYLESKTAAFVESLRSVASTTDTSTLFIDLLQNTLRPSQAPKSVKITTEDDTPQDPTLQLIKARVLQEMMDKLPDKLISDSKRLLELIGKVLNEYDTKSVADDDTSIALSLLNIVITAPGFQKSQADPIVLTDIEAILNEISKARDSEVSQTAHNLFMLLKYRDAVADPSEQVLSTPTDRQVEDRRTYRLGLSYITQADSPPPVRYEGLNLLSGLIQSGSPVVDIQSTLVLLSSLINDEEDYINLRVIKLFTQLAAKHPRSAVNEILEHYVDANENEKTDTRLRFGEALLQVINRLGETFTGQPALSVGQALLSIAGRRAQRPKTEAQQQRAERLRKMKKDQDKPGSSELVDLAEDEDERVRNELLARIVQGWESKRGAEDLRIRSSALSIFASAIETNVAGLGPTLVQTSIDVSIDILTFESTPEAGILRRSAIVLILTFIRALADAREQGRRLGFGLSEMSRGDIARVLEYLAQTDEDGLVREQARDVVESLENWKVAELLPPGGLQDDSQGPGLSGAGGGLKGLRIMDERPALPVLDQGLTMRPRIEEIE